jgi:hypothetical protein
MDKISINDKRLKKAFKGISFSCYKKSDAKKQLLNYLFSGKIEESCYWSAEFICAGHFIELWDIIFQFICDKIHLGNPRLPVYIEYRLDDFKNIVNSGYIENELKMRNNQKIRKLFAEIVSIICLSKKKNSFDPPKVKDTEFNTINLTHKLKAPTVEYGRRIFKKEDPKELFIAINELYWNIENKNSADAFYWIEWILGFEVLCKKNNKLKLLASRREVPVENKFQRDIIWLLWDVIFTVAKTHSKGIMKILEALLTMFCVRYGNATKRKRKIMIYFGISLLTEPFDSEIPLYKNDNIIKQVTKKIDNIYKQIKKNEVVPNTDYLFNNSINSGNLEKTLNKIDQMNSMNNIIYQKK